MMSSPGPSPTRYLFVDGGCVRAELDRISQDYLGQPGQARIAWAGLANDFNKVFYYDALPTRNEGESEEAYGLRNAPMLSLHEELGNLDRFHVYEGDRRRARGRGERAQQKKVDVMITVDMLMHTFRRNMHEATLMASDLDFAPLLQALVREGMYITLWYPPAATNAELRAAADSRRLLTPEGLSHALVTSDNKPFLPIWNTGSVSYHQHPLIQHLTLSNRYAISLHGKDGDHYMAEVSDHLGRPVGYAAHHNRRILLVTTEKRFNASLPDGTY